MSIEEKAREDTIRSVVGTSLYSHLSAYDKEQIARMAINGYEAAKAPEQPVDSSNYNEVVEALRKCEARLKDMTEKRDDLFKLKSLQSVEKQEWANLIKGKIAYVHANTHSMSADAFATRLAEGIADTVIDRLSLPERESGELDYRAEYERINKLINTPEINDFLKAIPLEAAHQKEKWGNDHDGGKTPQDWFWLIGYLAGKALHHTITTAAACLNWHSAMNGNTDMRPGIEPPSTQIEDQS